MVGRITRFQVHVTVMLKGHDNFDNLLFLFDLFYIIR